MESIGDYSSSDNDNIRDGIVGDWWVRTCTGSKALAPGWWWVSSLLIPDGYCRLFLTEADAREWAETHDVLTYQRRPADQPWLWNANRQPL